MEKCEGLEGIKHWIGLALMKQGRHEQGRRAIAKVWGGCLAQGVQLYFKKQYRRSIKQLKRCKKLGRALQWTGLALYKLGRIEEAKRYLQQTVELMPMGRCRPSLNHIIREVAAGHDHVHLVDLEAAAERASPGGIPGPELFVDNCHMSWAGYALMAEEVRAALNSAKVGPRWATNNKPLGMEAMGQKLGLPLSALKRLKPPPRDR